MTEGAFYLGAAIFFLALAGCLWPLRGPRLMGEADPRSASLRMEKDRLQNEIRDLEFDFQTGKLSREDYEGGREELVLEAVGVMEALDKSGSRVDLEKEIETWVAQARGKS